MGAHAPLPQRPMRSNTSLFGSAKFNNRWPRLPKQSRPPSPRP